MSELPLGQGLSASSRPRAKFTYAYRLVGCKVINDDNLLKLHGNILKILLTYYYKQVHISLSIFLMKLNVIVIFGAVFV
jgi:hypothetical protein